MLLILLLIQCSVNTALLQQRLISASDRESAYRSGPDKVNQT